MTPTQKRLTDAMRASVAGGSWEDVPNACGYTIRWQGEERQLDEPRGGWVGPYRPLVFLTLIRTPMLGVSKSPWSRRTDRKITYREAFGVLSDPSALV